MKYFVLICLGLGLLVFGCGERLSNQAQKTTWQGMAEAAKAASQTINDIKTDAEAKLKEIQEALAILKELQSLSEKKE